MKISLKIGLIAFFLVSCQRATPPSTITPTETVQPTEKLSPQVQVRQNEITSIWENSVHAQTADPVECDECHLIENGVVVDKVSQRNQQTGPGEAVSGSISLCKQCHAEVSVGHAHMSFACIECHDPHKIETSCTDSGCHTNIPTVFFELPATPTGGHPGSGASFCGGTNCHSVATAVAKTAGSIHGPEHARVTCEACHDASRFAAGPAPNDGTWVLWPEAEPNGTIPAEFIRSHDIQSEVDCARCHFQDNPWGLPLVDGQEFEK
jgi:hypothetical protein